MALETIAASTYCIGYSNEDDPITDEEIRMTKALGNDEKRHRADIIRQG